MHRTSDVTFQSIQQPSVVDQIIETIKQALITGELNPGQKLPSEPEMARQLGVGRSAVREAMKVLQALGVVVIRQGSGTYVAEGTSDKLLNPLTFNIILGANLSMELIELRLMCQIGYSELAASHATENDWACIEAAAALLEAKAAAPNADHEELAHLDLAFHYAILDATQNPLVIKIGRTVEELFFSSIRDNFVNNRANIEHALEVHREIIKSLRGGDPVAIRAAIVESLLNSPWKDEVKINKKTIHYFES